MCSRPDVYSALVFGLCLAAWSGTNASRFMDHSLYIKEVTRCTSTSPFPPALSRASSLASSSFMRCINRVTTGHVHVGGSVC